MTKRQRRRIKSKETNRVHVLTPLAAAVMTAIYPIAPAIAQDAADPSAEEAVEEIIVLGSRIRRDTFSSAAPIDVVLTESAPARGVTDLATLLQTTSVAMGGPQVNSAFSASSETASNGGLGTNTLSLRFERWFGHQHAFPAWPRRQPYTGAAQWSSRGTVRCPGFGNGI